MSGPQTFALAAAMIAVPLFVVTCIVGWVAGMESKANEWCHIVGAVLVVIILVGGCMGVGLETP